MKYKLITVTIIALVISLISFAVENKQPLIEVSNYDSFYNLYNYDDQVQLMVVKNDEVIDYYLTVGSAYEVKIFDSNYTNVKDLLLDFDSVNQDSYIKLEVYTLSLEYETSYHFYYTHQASNLNYLIWHSFNPEKYALLSFVIIFTIGLASLAIYELISKYDHDLEPKSDKLIDLFKASSWLNKVMFILFLMLSILIPQILAILLLIFFIREIYIKRKNFTQLINASLIFILLIFSSLAIYLGIVYASNPTARVHDLTIITNEPLTDSQTMLYQEIVKQSDYYEVNPIINYESTDFSILALSGYKTTLSFTEPEIFPHIQFMISSNLSSNSNLYQIVVLENNVPENNISIKDGLSEVNDIYIAKGVDTIKLEIRVKETMEKIFESEIISVYQDIDDNPKQIAFGLQHSQTPNKDILINQLSFLCGTLFFYMMVFRLKNIVFNGILEDHFFNTMLKKKKD